MGDLHIVLAAEAHKVILVRGADDHGHALLRLADGKLRGVEPAVLDRDAVEVYVQPVGKLPYRHAHAPRTEIVGFLDEACDLGAAQQALEFALLGGVAFLHLAATGLQR